MKWWTQWHDESRIRRRMLATAMEALRVQHEVERQVAQLRQTLCELELLAREGVEDEDGDGDD